MLLLAIVCIAPGLTFDAPRHRYTLDGAVVPSVTGILKASGLIDFSGIPEGILEAARVRGTTVHTALHYFNENDLDVDQFRADFPSYAPYVDAWIAFCQQRNFLALINERRVASRRHQIAGTIDCLGLLDGTACLLDFATGRPEDCSKDLQTGAYHALALEWADDGNDEEIRAFVDRSRGVIRRYAVALRKDGTFRVEPYRDPSDFRQFLALVEAQRIVHARRGEQWSEVGE